MTRDELEALAISYSHKPELTSDLFDDFFALAGSRIGRDLKSTENETALLAETYATNLNAVPSDYGSMRALEYAKSSGPVNLASRDLASINDFRASGGDPRVYLVRARIIDIRPFVAGDYNLYYYHRPVLAAGDSSNAVSITWPNVYLSALLVEIQLWAQDQRNLEVARGNYKSEIAETNREASRSQGDKPAMRKVGR